METLIALIGSLIVLMLGWLHFRLNRMERQHDEAVARLYDHVGSGYARREAVGELATRISELVGRLDSLMQLMLKQNKQS